MDDFDITAHYPATQNSAEHTPTCKKHHEASEVHADNNNKEEHFERRIIKNKKK